jgi:hypothetical protein
MKFFLLHRYRVPFQYPVRSQNALESNKVLDLYQFVFKVMLLLINSSLPGRFMSINIFFGISVNKYSKYSYGFKVFAFAVSVRLYIMAEEFAPRIVSMTCQFFLPIQKPRMERSLAYLYIRIS